MKIAYVLLRFPSLTETFIAEEIQKIQGAGVEVIIYSLLPPTEELVQPVSKSLLHLRKTPPGILHPAIHCPDDRERDRTRRRSAAEPRRRFPRRQRLAHRYGPEERGTRGEVVCCTT